jgi:hypothetical protein
VRSRISRSQCSRIVWTNGAVYSGCRRPKAAPSSSALSADALSSRRSGGYTFEAETRFDKLFVGLVIQEQPQPPGRESFITPGDHTGTDNLGPSDEDYGRLLERAYKGGTSQRDSNHCHGANPWQSGGSVILRARRDGGQAVSGLILEPLALRGWQRDDIPTIGWSRPERSGAAIG